MFSGDKMNGIPARLLVLLLGVGAVCGSAFAHHGLGPTTAKAFFKVDTSEAHLLIRVPLSVLETAGLSLTDREIDLAHAGPAIQSVLDELATKITIEEDGRALTPVQRSGRLSLPSDRSFDSYPEALRHISEPMPPGLTIYAEQGSLDALLAYPIRSPHARFSIRSRAFPEMGDYLTLSVSCIIGDAAPRLVTLSSVSSTVHLSPRWYQVVGEFIVRGGTVVSSSSECLLLLVCFFVPPRSARRQSELLATFSGALCLTLLIFGRSATAAETVFVMTIVAAVTASVVCAAIASAVSPEGRGGLVVSVVSGVLFGLLFALAFRENLQFAGDYSVLSLLAFSAGAMIGLALVAAILQMICPLFLQYVFVGRAGPYVVLGLIALIAWPWMLERGEFLSRTDWLMEEFRTVRSWIFGGLILASVIRFLLPRLRGVRRRRRVVTAEAPLPR